MNLTASGKYKHLQNLNTTDTHHIENITDENLESAAKSFVYLYLEPRNLWFESMEFFFKSAPTSVRNTLLLVANYDPQDYLQETVKRILLELLSKHMKLEFFNIDNFRFVSKFSGITLLLLTNMYF